MGKRNVRIPGSKAIERFSEYANVEVQIVANDGKTYLGKAQKHGPSTLQIVDSNAFWYNRRKHTHRIPASEIREVIYDLVTEY